MARRLLFTSTSQAYPPLSHTSLPMPTPRPSVRIFVSVTLACSCVALLTGCGDDDDTPTRSRGTSPPRSSSPYVDIHFDSTWRAFWASDMGDRETPRPLALGARTTLLLDCPEDDCSDVDATVAPAGVVAINPSANGFAVRSVDEGSAVITLTSTQTDGTVRSSTHPIDVVEPARVWLSNSTLALDPSWQPSSADPDTTPAFATFGSEEVELYLYTVDAEGRRLGGREVVPLSAASSQGGATLSFDAGTRYVFEHNGDDSLAQIIAGEGDDARVMLEIEPVTAAQVQVDSAAVFEGLVFFDETPSVQRYIQSGETVALGEGYHFVHLMARTQDGRPVLGNGDQPPELAPTDASQAGEAILLGIRGVLVDASIIDTLAVRLEWLGTFEFTVHGALHADAQAP